MDLFLATIKDPKTRDALQTIEQFINTFAILKGQWRFIEISVSGAVANFTYPHNLKFTPRDVIQTSVTGPGSIFWNYSRFDGTNLDITTTDECTVRAFIGTYGG